MFTSPTDRFDPVYRRWRLRIGLAPDGRPRDRLRGEVGERLRTPGDTVSEPIAVGVHL